jgi:glycosyltransferase involved in cell wall biosynthesis
LRIAFLGTANPEANASQVRLYHLARGMAEAGHEVTVVVPDDPVNRDFPVMRASAAAFHAIKARWAIAEMAAKLREVRAGDFDVVHVVGIGLRSLQLIGRPWKRPFYVQDYDELITAQAGHSLARRAYYASLEGLTRARAHAILVASRALERLVRTRRPDLGRRLLYLPIGYDPSFEGAGTHLDRQLRAMADERPVLTWVGGFWPAYSIDELTGLGSELARRGRNFVLMLVGDGPDLEAAKRAVAARNLDGRVILTGRVSLADLEAYLRVSQAFLLPFPPNAQNLYRCPTKLFQYIAHRRPIVTNRVGEVAEALGDAGFYYRPRSVESMADACEQAIAGAAEYDGAGLAASIQWSQRARRYREWLECLDLPA